MGRCEVLEMLLSSSLGALMLQDVSRAHMGARFYHIFFSSFFPFELSLAASFYNRKEPGVHE